MGNFCINRELEETFEGYNTKKKTELKSILLASGIKCFTAIFKLKHSL